MSTLLQIAFGEMGQREVEGAYHNQRILEYAELSGIEHIHDDETPWCSIFVNYCCHQCDLPKSGKANARSWMHIGMKTVSPEPGDIVVFWRENLQSWKGHLGFFLGFNHDLSQVFCLGGNQGNSVSIASYDASKVLGFRRVSEEGFRQIPRPVLKEGSRGEEVVKLQLLLNHLGYNCGDPDGIFGSKTTNALRLLQANHRLAVDGIYGSGTQNALESFRQS